MASTLVPPLLISVPWGVGAANPTFINIPIPVPSQISTTINAASFTDGFPPNTMTPEASGGLPFFGQDMNGILYMLSAYCANFAAGAFSKYNATLSTAITGYPLGAVLGNTDGNGLWISQVDGNTTNPDAGGAGWLPFGGVGGVSITVSGSNITLTALQAALPFISFGGTLTGNINVIFPVSEGQSWILSNITAGAFTITAKTASGTGVVVPPTGFPAPTSVYCDGTNIQNTGVSTAGLAPINSPALTGTPTAPTATPATTNTTQIATTAFVQNALTAALATYAHLASPTFSGIPTAPTAVTATSNAQIASTAFVHAAIAAAAPTQTRSAVVALTGGANSISFSPAFPNTVISVVMQAYGTSASTAVTSQSRTGFTCNVNDTHDYSYIATGT